MFTTTTESLELLSYQGLQVFPLRSGHPTMVQKVLKGSLRKHTLQYLLSVEPSVLVAMDVILMLAPFYTLGCAQADVSVATLQFQAVRLEVREI